jgi:hypothetical protein
MKIAFVRHATSCAILGAILGWPVAAVAGDDGDLLKQAEDLVHQAWNPGGDAPSNDDRTQLINKAIELAQKEPDHRLHGTRVEAIRLLKAALEQIKNGDPDNRVSGELQDADRELRDAMEGAQSH